MSTAKFLIFRAAKNKSAMAMTASVTVTMASFRQRERALVSAIDTATIDRRRQPGEGDPAMECRYRCLGQPE